MHWPIGMLVVNQYMTVLLRQYALCYQPNS